MRHEESAWFVFTYGQHWAEVTALTNEVGDPFTGAATAIPTTTRWEDDSFLGVSIDLRAAVELLKTLTSRGK